MRRFRLPAVGTIALLSLGVTACSHFPSQTAPKSVDSRPDTEIEDSTDDDGAGPRLANIYDDDSTAVDVVRVGRYQLVQANAQEGQKHLLEQIVSVQIPPIESPSVGDAIRYVLKGTGYQLCDPRGTAMNYLYSRPLPGPHYQMGPMPLRAALEMLAGEPWTLDADRITRTVCYEPTEQVRFGVTVASDRREQWRPIVQPAPRRQSETMADEDSSSASGAAATTTAYEPGARVAE
ncbi:MULTISPECIES: hypothetical protein [unclassified Modicisalibacter]|uniref:PFGI-1 class ICE element type IV pilus protein PilL2 n=1 Tax=unclassified Modicisalibacter TaxID=2679913 RepID=UPI001CCC7259|nr:MULTISPECIES: hypothetical protein [unclassified Modicisalibacter]MBZ9559047.1 hypothetical protein [Modicisalibacter sp. R2A 31.J]MBZ9576842.1 hypothetical protein [Modicisalibacter sp. MOD 31.J]